MLIVTNDGKICCKTGAKTVSNLCLSPAVFLEEVSIGGTVTTVEQAGEQVLSVFCCMKCT